MTSRWPGRGCRLWLSGVSEVGFTAVLPGIAGGEVDAVGRERFLKGAMRAGGVSMDAVEEVAGKKDNIGLETGGEGYYAPTKTEAVDVANGRRNLIPCPRGSNTWRRSSRCRPAIRRARAFWQGTAYTVAGPTWILRAGFLIPEELRNAGMVNEDVSVTGEGNLLRVTVISRLRESVQGKAMAAQETDALAECGL